MCVCVIFCYFRDNLYVYTIGLFVYKLPQNCSIVLLQSWFVGNDTLKVTICTFIEFSFVDTVFFVFFGYLGAVCTTGRLVYS